MPNYRPLTDEERDRIAGRTGEPATPIRPTIGRPDREPGYRPPPPNPNRVYPPGHPNYRPPPTTTTPPRPPTLPTTPGPPNRRPPSGAMPNDIGQEPSFGPDEDENLGEDETYARLVKKQDSGMELTQEERQFMMDYENGRQGADRIVGGTMSAGSMPMGPSMGRGALHL